MSVIIGKSPVEAANEKIERMLADRRARVAEAEEALSADEVAIQRAEAAMKKAVAANDLEAFQKAKKALQNAKDSQELHTAWMETAKEQPGISPEEYDQTVKTIYAELDALEGEVIQKAMGLADALSAEGERLKAAQERANEVLKRLQHDLYKDADRPRNSSGKPIVTSGTDKAINKWETINFTQAAKNHPFYTEFARNAALIQEADHE